MTITEPHIEQILHRYADAKNSHDVDAILALCTEDCRYQTVALGAPIEGKAALRDFYTALFDALPDYTGDFEGTAFGPDSAVVWGRFAATSNGHFMGIEVETGRRIEVPVTFVCQFRDGLIHSDRGFFDLATLAEQLGVPLDRIRPSAADLSADSFVERFRRVWAQPHIAGLLALIPDLRLDVTEHAEAGELTFISWQATATVNGHPLEWTGIDRFRVRDGRAVEALVAYDTLPLRESLRRAG